MRKSLQVWIPILFVALATVAASAQSFRVQCPTSTITHPTAANNNVEPPYTGVTTFTTNAKGYQVPSARVNGAIKCQQISGGDGYSTMANGTQTFMFSFGPLSGLADIAAGLPGTEFPNVFNSIYPGTLLPGDPAATDGASTAAPYNLLAFTNPTGTAPLFSYNGAIGQVPDADQQAAGLCGGSGQPSCIDGHVDPRQIMDVGVMNGNIPAPLMAIDEDDEFFLTLTNVGMIMRPDLFEQHTVHFHGYPNASAFYDGVPDASVAINIGGSFTYYYLAPDAGTYFWHCHITPPEHLQMGMVGQLYVRPRQNRTPVGTDLFTTVTAMQGDLRTACQGTGGGSTAAPGVGYTYGNGGNIDILCSAPLPIGDMRVNQVAGQKYAYNDGDGSTAYDIDVPIQIHGFDPNFHFVGMTFNPEGFADMKDKYFLLNGRSYPDTVGVPGYQGLAAATSTDAAGNQVLNPDPVTHSIATESSDGFLRPSQPLPTLITLSSSGAAGAPRRALLRIADLDVTEYQTLQTLGIPLTIVGWNAKLLRDQAGNNLFIKTNSITLGGGESLDAILDATGIPPGTYFLYTSNLDHLSNDAENFGGLMTEVVVNP